MSEPTAFGPDAQKHQVIPFFHTVSVLMDFKSREAGRPIHEDQEFVKIVIAGNRNAVVDERVTEEHKARWPQAYEAFKAGKELPLEGTPLRHWPHSQMTAARADDLAYFHIRTVEQLAAMTDDKLQNLGMGARDLRKAAQLFLDAAKNGTGPLEKMISENMSLRDDNKRLTDELTAANSELRALTARLAKLEKADA